MKYRTQFVANSSSMSFVIAGGDSPVIKVTLEIPVADLSDLVTNNGERIKKWFMDNYSWDRIELDERDQKRLDKALERIANGKTIYVGTFSNESGNSIEDSLYDLGELPMSEDYEIIYYE